MTAGPKQPAGSPADAPRLRIAAETDPQAARELELVERIQGGDQQAWAELLGDYQHRIFAICSRMLANRETAADLAQDAMVKVIQGIDRFDGRAKLSTWIYRITMNACLTHLRDSKRRSMASLDAQLPGSASEGPRTSSGPAQHREQDAASGVQEAGNRRDLGEALMELSDEHRAILILRDARQLEYDVIADVLDIAVGTVKSRLFRARTALRKALESREPEGTAPEPTTQTTPK